MAVIPLPAESGYLLALCSPELLPPADSAALLDQLATNLRNLPTEAPEEAAEAERLATLVERADDDDDIDALLEVGAVLGARCG